MVVTARPSTCTASVRQESTRSPSTCTVQAPALALIATFLGAGQFKVFAQRIQKGHAWFDDKGFCLAIDFED